MNYPTEKEIAEELEKINNMSHEDMAYMWRFAEGGHKYFHRDLPYSKVFQERFKSFGGMTPEISKQIGL